MAQTPTTLARTIEPSVEELPELRHLLESLGGGAAEAKLVGPDGEVLSLTPSVRAALRAVLLSLSNGQAISLVPAHTMLTTNEAADFLNVSRPHLIKLLERGDIPFTMVGTHRRVAFQALVAYRERRQQSRAEGLAELAELDQLQSKGPVKPLRRNAS